MTSGPEALELSLHLGDRDGCRRSVPGDQFASTVNFDIAKPPY